MRHAPLTLAACLALSVPAAAQEAPLGWSELIAPDRLARSAVQSLLLALRTQTDLTWESMTVDMRRGTVALSGLTLRPMLEFDRDFDCRIDADRATLTLYDLATPDAMRLGLRLGGIEAALACLPPAAQMAPRMAGLSALSVPLVTAELSYDIPSAGADLGMFLQIDGALAAELSARFDYLWIEPEADGTDADPVAVAYLEEARLRIDDLGLWETLSALAPPPILDPETGGTAAAAFVQGALAGFAAPGPLPPEADALIASVAEAWQGFVADPGTLVLETGFDPEAPVYLDLEAYKPSPLALIVDLAPELATATRARRAAISPDRLAAALGPEGADLPRGERLTLGRALVTGDGAPRNLAAGQRLLRGLADEDDAEAQAALAQSLAATSPAEAYALALTAGDVALMDRLEADLELGRILAAQPGPEDLDPAGIDRLPDLRQAALAAAEGREMPRSYGQALVWAGLGRALGDAVSADLARGLEARFAAADPAGWEALAAAAEDEATRLWLETDLAERLGGE
ncbi:hypothetical protein E2L08_09685 [Palleronia sediminis]|uniref:Uncharacterized protein n=1 Tax=Palleronia sediminis TaxID=2547833 RepID=A0A4R6A9J7_9RHOB|nr:hypothetical protein [Palleronia sediminis]TDL79565.1 hypothetical protein E2L08_09685 [Palleronia sediminis]